jgi:hypothetical protein
MFIELAEYLRCTGGHDEMHCVVLPEAMVGRTVIRGTVDVDSSFPSKRRSSILHHPAALWPIFKRLTDFPWTRTPSVR